MDPIPFLPTLCAVTAGSAAALGAWVLTGLGPSRRAGAAAADYASEQVRVLERTDATHRWAGALVAEVVPIVEAWCGRATLDRVARDLETSGRSPPWSASRFVAVAWVRGGGVALAVTGFAAACGAGVMAPVFGIVTGAVFVAAVLSSLHGEADGRARDVGASLAFAADLMTLVLRAGGTPGEAFQAVAAETGGTAVGAEFRRIVEDVARGTPRVRALQAFAERFPDPAVKDFTFAIVKGEETGMPIGATLAAQSAELRRKLSQSCERQAAEAGVKMSFPNMLVMIACMILMAGPFILPAIYQ